MARKREKPVLTQEEQARRAALRRAARLDRRRSSAYEAARLVREAQQAPERARLAASSARQTRLKQQERERALVTANATRHIKRLREANQEGCPWDDEFLQELRGLLSWDSEERAVKVALAVTTDLLSWRLPDNTLMERLQLTVSPLAADARASREFMTFVRGQILPSHQRWARGEQQKELARLKAQQPALASDRELERQRQDATARRRPVAKRFF